VPSPSEQRPAPARTAHALLRITNPSEGSIYLKDPTLRPGFQTLALRAVAAGGTRELEWAVDGRQVGTSAPERPLDWPLAIGKHHIAVTDDQGHRAEAGIVVR